MKHFLYLIYVDLRYTKKVSAHVIEETIENN